MIRIVLVLVICVSFFLVLPAQDTLTYKQEPVVVTANRTPVNMLYTIRSIDVVDQQMLKSISAFAIEDVLQRCANINVQPRGVFGVQSDVSIRGALFSQQLVLFNGVRINDTQTGHYNFDISVPLEQIERVEVLKGAGSALYGPDAYGGVINIITRIPEQQSLSLKLSGGENGLVNTSAGYEFSASGIQSSNMVEHRRSDGYRYDTEFRISSFASSNKLELPIGTYSLFGAYTQKEFGAFNFYGPSPSKEWTETAFLSVSTEITISSINLQPKLSYRRHYDKFMYDLRTPNILVSIHTTNSYSGEILSITQLYESFSLLSGIDGNADNIVSTNLRNHSRTSVGLFVITHGVIQNKIIMDLGIREDVHSIYGTQFNPSVGLGYLFSQNMKVFVSAGRSFRAPSYTELYYKSPSRVGNENLKPEIGWSYEIGLDLSLNRQSRAKASLFLRKQENIIDYVKFSAADIVDKASNFASAATRGIEMSFRWNNEILSCQSSGNYLRLDDISVSYTYLDSRIELGNIYRTIYSLTHPRHQIGSTVSGILPLSVNGTVNATYKIKLDGKSYTLLDAKLSRKLSPATIFLQGTNLLNQSYEEIADIPLPGRWLWAGIEFKIL